MSLIQTFPDGGGGSVGIDGSTATPTDVVATWLACAGLHQSYTTLNEVLADSAVLSALMASTNAVDYLVRSTTWATDICANETAMNCIGVNDYCADILLADSTWRTAICNSTYFEEVLNVKVPTMTNNTTPSGVVSASSYYSSSFEPYYPFDGTNKDSVTATYWQSTASSSYSNQYIQYDFGRQIELYKVVLDNHARYNSTTYWRDLTYDIETSSDGINFTKVKTGEVARISSNNFINTSIIEKSICRYVRILCTTYDISYEGNLSVGIYRLQFYGRSGISSDVSINDTGTASASTTRQQQLTIDGISTDISGSKYMEQTISAQANTDTTFTFTNAALTYASVLDILSGCKTADYDIPTLKSKTLSVSGGTGTLTLVYNVPTAYALTVRVYIRG